MTKVSKGTLIKFLSSMKHAIMAMSTDTLTDSQLAAVEDSFTQVVQELEA
jgi:flagellin-like hook-associated protein FlgL